MVRADLKAAIASDAKRHKPLFIDRAGWSQTVFPVIIGKGIFAGAEYLLEEGFYAGSQSALLE
jgi:hypothetical protein